MNSTDWKSIVSDYRDKLEREEPKGYYSIKDLCRGLLEEWNIKDCNTAIEYLKDYIKVSETHYAFHSKWPDIPNMKNVAEYDKKEIEKVNELIKLLELCGFE